MKSSTEMSEDTEDRGAITAGFELPVISMRVPSLESGRDCGGIGGGLGGGEGLLHALKTLLARMTDGSAQR